MPLWQWEAIYEKGWLRAINCFRTIGHYSSGSVERIGFVPRRHNICRLSDEPELARLECLCVAGTLMIHRTKGSFILKHLKLDRTQVNCGKQRCFVWFHVWSVVVYTSNTRMNNWAYPEIWAESTLQLALIYPSFNPTPSMTPVPTHQHSHLLYLFTFQAKTHLWIVCGWAMAT